VAVKKQIKPLMLLHVALPHLQVSVFSAEPFVTRQAGAEQVLVEAVQ